MTREQAIDMELLGHTKTALAEHAKLYAANCELRALNADMLAALEMIESCLAPEDNDEAARAVRAAIKRATGEK